MATRTPDLADLPVARLDAKLSFVKGGNGAQMSLFMLSEIRLLMRAIHDNCLYDQTCLAELDFLWAYVQELTADHDFFGRFQDRYGPVEHMTLEERLRALPSNEQRRIVDAIASILANEDGTIDEGAAFTDVSDEALLRTGLVRPT